MTAHNKQQNRLLSRVHIFPLYHNLYDTEQIEIFTSSSLLDGSDRLYGTKALLARSKDDLARLTLNPPRRTKKGCARWEIHAQPLREICLLLSYIKNQVLKNSYTLESGVKGNQPPRPPVADLTVTGQQREEYARKIVARDLDITIP